MKTVKCKNCGASFDDDLAQCPYCGTMNKKGAYREFRLKVSDIIDSVLGLKEDVQRSVSSIILNALLRSIVLIALIVGLAFIGSNFAKVNYQNDKEYDQEALDDILWMDEHLDALNEAYENGDYKTVKDLYYDNSSAVRNWNHYPTYCLKSTYSELMNSSRFDAATLQKVLYFFYYPEYFSGYNTMRLIDKEEYGEMCASLLSSMEKRGYTEEELKDIYEKCSDPHGYTEYEKLKQYVKEDGNGQL